MFSRDSLCDRAASLWRYQESLGIPDPGNAVTLGEDLTPVEESRLGGRPHKRELNSVAKSPGVIAVNSKR